MSVIIGSGEKYARVVFHSCFLLLLLFFFNSVFFFLCSWLIEVVTYLVTMVLANLFRRGGDRRKLEHMQGVTFRFSFFFFFVSRKADFCDSS